MVTDEDYQSLKNRVLVLEAMLLTSAEPGDVDVPPEGKHHWAAVLDHGGQVPVYMPVDARAKPLRMIATTRGDALVLHFQCSRCGERGERRFTLSETRKSDHRPHYDLRETASLSDGPCCPKAAAPAPGILERIARLFRGEPAPLAPEPAAQQPSQEISS